MPHFTITAAALATGNPIIIGIVGATELCVFTALVFRIRQLKTAAEQPQKALTMPPPVAFAYAVNTKERAVTQIQQTKDHVQRIATTTQQQTKTIADAALSTQQSAQRLNQASSNVQRTTNTLENQTTATQRNLDEVTRLRGELSTANAALRRSQQVLTTREHEITRLTTALNQTNQTLLANTREHQAAATRVINRAQGALQNHTTPLLEAKEREINVLKRERDELRAMIRQMDQALSALQNPRGITTPPNHPSALRASSVFTDSAHSSLNSRQANASSRPVNR